MLWTKATLTVRKAGEPTGFAAADYSRIRNASNVQVALARWRSVALRSVAR